MPAAPLTPAQQELVAANVGLAWRCAWRCRTAGLIAGLTHDDLYAEAIIGMCVAASRWDPARAKFSTFATWWCRAKVSHAISPSRSKSRCGRTLLATDCSDDDDDGGGLLARLPAPAEPDPDARLDLAEPLAQLSPRYRQVLVMRFGLDGGGERSLAEIGEALGVCKERIRQVLDDALVELRLALRRRRRNERAPAGE